MKAPYFLQTLLLVGLMSASAFSGLHAEPLSQGVVRTTQGEIVRDTAGNCVHTDWLTDQNECGSRRVAINNNQEMENKTTLKESDRTAYFNFDSSPM